MAQDEARSAATDPFADVRRTLFPPLRNRKLFEAADALAANQLDIARPLVSKFLAKHPEDPAALNLMADIARRSGRVEEAAQLLVRCIQKDPDCPGYRFNHATALRQLNSFEQALAELDELLNENPKNPLYRDQKARVLEAMGRHADALVHRRELSEDYPASPDAWVNYGLALRRLGYQDQCVAAYHRALEIAPSPGKIYWHLADVKTYRFTESEVERMEMLLAQPGLSPDDRADLHFALGKARGDQKFYSKSFENYAKGNALRRLRLAPDPERLTAHRSNCASLFTEAFFHDRIGWGCNSDAPIFVVGMPRSGSTLVEQILSSHTAIEGLGEIPDMDTIVRRLLSGIEFQNSLQAYIQIVKSLDATGFRSLGEAYLELTHPRRKLGRPFFTDKSLTNFGQVGLIHLILPNARIVDIRRHPLDCGWSCFKSHFSGSQPFSHRLIDIGHRYADYFAIMTHFERVLPGRIHRVIYENLISDQESEVRRLFDYLGLPFEEQCLRFYENRRAVVTPSSEQVRTPLYKSGIGQWQPYEAWLGPLKTALGQALDHYAAMPRPAASMEEGRNTSNFLI